MSLDNNASSGAIKDIPQLTRLVEGGMKGDACKAYEMSRADHMQNCVTQTVSHV